MSCSRNCRILRLLFLVFWLASVPGAHAQDAPPNPHVAALRAKLARQLEQLAAEFDGVMGIAVKDLTSGETIRVNADMVFPQAS